jgi:16S rRNA (cytidine1402-2'-O)-methyltransferase
MPGVLYIVATPIGNLGDITYRAVEVLRGIDAIACEDTRQTRKLLDHYGIQKPLVSYHKHNEAERTRELLARLRLGEAIALVSDAGVPLISDPGYRLVRAAVQAGIELHPLPGPCAAIAALAAAGLPTESFHFAGFLPPKRAQRLKALKALSSEAATLIFYEAPHRILDSLKAIHEVLGPRPVVVARELTKIHEEFLRGTAEEIHRNLAERSSIKGEFTILVGRASGEPAAGAQPVGDAVEALIRAGAPRMDAIKQVARRLGLSKREIYDRLLRER